MNEVSRVTKEAEWFQSQKWPYLPGDPVLIVQRKTLKIGRIDMVRLHYCPTQNQGKDPDKDTLWPIYFFGEIDKKKKRQWVPTSSIKTKIHAGKAKTFNQARECIEETIKNQGFEINSKISQAIESVINNPMEEHQLILSDEEMAKNSTLKDLHVETFTKWFCNDEDIELKYDWFEEGQKLGIQLAVKRADLNRLNSSMVVDDLGAADDPLQVLYQDSLIKVADCEVGDFVGCVYDTNFMGRVIKKEPEKIRVRFYSEQKPKGQSKKSTKASKESNTESYWVPKKHDTDFITQNRQNYLYYHLKESDFVAESVNKNGRLKRQLKNGQDWEKFESQREEEWNLHTKKLRLKMQGDES